MDFCSEWLSFTYSVPLQSMGHVLVWVSWEANPGTGVHVHVASVGDGPRQHPLGRGQARQGWETVKDVGESEIPQKALRGQVAHFSSSPRPRVLRKVKDPLCGQAGAPIDT